MVTSDKSCRLRRVCSHLLRWKQNAPAATNPSSPLAKEPSLRHLSKRGLSSVRIVKSGFTFGVDESMPGGSGTCPGCSREILRGAFYCPTCGAPARVQGDSAWPKFQCEICSQPASMVALQGVGTLEIAVLVFIGIIALFGFVDVLSRHPPMFLGMMLGLVVIPLCLPWIVQGLADPLNNLLQQFFHYRIPGVEGVRLHIAAARDFRAKPFGFRLWKVYAVYAKRTVPVMICCIVAYGLFLLLRYWFY